MLLSQLWLSGAERPGEAGEGLARRDTSGSKAPPDEERRAIGGGGDGSAVGADSFCSPAVGEADYEEPRVRCGFEEALGAGADEEWLGDDADQLLHEERRAGE